MTPKTPRPADVPGQASVPTMPAMPAFQTHPSAAQLAAAQRPFSQACANNQAPILAVLEQAFAGCRRVLDFTPQTICLDLGEGIVTLYGQELRIESLSGKRLVAAGRVHRIELKNKWGTDHETL